MPNTKRVVSRQTLTIDTSAAYTAYNCPPSPLRSIQRMGPPLLDLSHYLDTFALSLILSRSLLRLVIIIILFLHFDLWNIITKSVPFIDISLATHSARPPTTASLLHLPTDLAARVI